MESNVRWTIKVSKETDISLRTFLAKQGMKKGDLSKFVEDAVRWRVFDKAVQNIRKRNEKISDVDLQEIVDEAVGLSRSRKLHSLSGKK